MDIHHPLLKSKTAKKKGKDAASSKDEETAAFTPENDAWLECLGKTLEQMITLGAQHVAGNSTKTGEEFGVREVGFWYR